MKFLKLELAGSQFGLLLDQVREVIAFPEFTQIPNVHQSFLGIANIRSEIIPLIDLRIHLKMKPTLTVDTAVVICDLKSRIVGVVVDVIHNVVTVSEADVCAKNAGSNIGNGSVVDVVNHNNDLILILDMKQLLSETEVGIDMLKAHG